MGDQVGLIIELIVELIVGPSCLRSSHPPGSSCPHWRMQRHCTPEIGLEILHLVAHAIGKKMQKQECIPVGCVPPACWLSAWGCLPGGCVCLGLSAQGGVCPGGISAGGSAQGGVCHTPLWTDRHLWKHNLRKLRLRAVKNCPCSW